MQFRRISVTLFSALFLVAAGLLLFSATGGDDAHITWWSAYSLAEYGQMEEYSGERVEQSSSLLNVLVLAGIRFLTHAPMPVIGIVVSLLFGALSVWGSASLVRRITQNSLAHMLAPAFTATCFPLVYWSTSGMDTSLAAFTFTLFLLCSISFLLDGKRIAWSAVAGLLYLLARPEGFFVLTGILSLCFASSFLPGMGEGGALRRRILFLFLALLPSFLLLCLFRELYFGRLFPEPVYTKVAGITWFKTKSGIKYLLRNLGSRTLILWLVLVLLSLFSLWRGRVEGAGSDKPRTRFITALLLSAFLSVLAFITLTGGDWMENGRYLVPLFPAAMALVATGFSTRRRYQPLWIFGLLGIHVLALVLTSSQFSRGRPLWTSGNLRITEAAKKEFSFFQYMCKDGERDIPTALQLDEVYQRVRLAKGDTVNIMSGQGGMIIYHLACKHPHAFRWVDIWGLSDRSVATCPPTRAVQVIPIPTWTWEKYFELLPQIRATCPAFPEPDIICELDDVNYMPPILEKNGYKVVYQQSGFMLSGDPLFPGLRLNAGQVIAVKNDLATRAGFTSPVTYHFPDQE